MRSGLLITWTLLLLCLAGMPSFGRLAGAVPAEDIEVGHSFDRTDYVSGEYGNISLTIKSLCGEKVRIRSVLVRTDWQRSNESYEGEPTSDPVLNATGDICTFRVEFTVPQNPNAVDHAWNMTVSYTKVTSPDSNETWRSENLTDLKVSDFELVIYPGSKTITAGQRAAFTVTVWGKNGFTKVVELYYRADPVNSHEQSISGRCYPGWVKRSGASSLQVQTNSSSHPGKYKLTLVGHCEEGYIIDREWIYKGIQHHVDAVLIVNPPPKAFVDISANCAAQLGIAAVNLLAVITACLFASEKRREGKDERQPPW